MLDKKKCSSSSAKVIQIDEGESDTIADYIYQTCSPDVTPEFMDNKRTHYHTCQTCQYDEQTIFNLVARLNRIHQLENPT